MVTMVSRLLEKVQESSSECLAHSGDPCLEMSGCSGQAFTVFGHALSGIVLSGIAATCHHAAMENLKHGWCDSEASGC